VYGQKPQQENIGGKRSFSGAVMGRVWKKRKEGSFRQERTIQCVAPEEGGTIKTVKEPEQTTGGQERGLMNLRKGLGRWLGGGFRSPGSKVIVIG